jgi:hypothetical protein
LKSLVFIRMAKRWVSKPPVRESFAGRLPRRAAKSATFRSRIGASDWPEKSEFRPEIAGKLGQNGLF